MPQQRSNILSDLRMREFDVTALHHAEAILRHDMPDALHEIEDTLLELAIPLEELVSGGGGEAKHTQRLRHKLTKFGWAKRNIEIRKFVDDREVASLSHEIDHVKTFGGSVAALEIEWNNKDPFFDRDLENFKRLHAEGAISLGCIVTRGQSMHDGFRSLFLDFAEKKSLQRIEDLESYGYQPTRRQRTMIESRIKQGSDFPHAWSTAFVADKFGEATTHWRKLQDRVHRGVGNPCPLLLIGLPLSTIVTG